MTLCQFKPTSSICLCTARATHKTNTNKRLPASLHPCLPPSLLLTQHKQNTPCLSTPASLLPSFLLTPPCLPAFLPLSFVHNTNKILPPPCLPASLSPCLPVSLFPTFLSSCLPAFLPPGLPASILPAIYLLQRLPCLPAFLPLSFLNNTNKRLPASLPPCLPAFLPPCIPASLPPCLDPP